MDAVRVETSPTTPACNPKDTNWGTAMNGRSIGQIGPTGLKSQDTIAYHVEQVILPRRYSQTPTHSETAYSTQDDTGYKSYGETEEAEPGTCIVFPPLSPATPSIFRAVGLLLSIPGDGRHRVDPGRRSSRL
jgi:hypothetical protein